MRRWAGAAAVGAIALMTTATAFATQAPAEPANPPMTGEWLKVGTATLESANCDEQGTSTYTVHGTGVAVGPYPGIYDARITVTVGPQTNPVFFNETQGTNVRSGPITDVQETFSIVSGLTRIEGTKTFDADYATFTNAVIQNAICDDVLAHASPNTQAFCSQWTLALGNMFTRYSATIHSPLGTSTDIGRSSNVASGSDNVCGGVRMNQGTFTETFIASFGPGTATGGGKTAPDTTFTFTAKSDASGTKGGCNVVDHVTGVHLKCLDVTTYSQTATHATFTGRAVLEGVEQSYTIDVTDSGEGSALPDRFRIITSGGYTAGGLVTEGNVQVR